MKYKIVIVALCSLTALASQNGGNRKVTITNYFPGTAFTAYYYNKFSNPSHQSIVPEQSMKDTMQSEEIVLTWDNSQFQQKINIAPNGDKIIIVPAICFKTKKSQAIFFQQLPSPHNSQYQKYKKSASLSSSSTSASYDSSSD